MNSASATRLFELVASAPDDRPMLIAQGRRLSYGDMRRQVASLASGLGHIGIGRGDRVAVWLPNDPAWFTVVLACSRIGAAIVSLNVRLGAKEAGELISRTVCKAVVLMPQHRDGACVAALRSVPAALRDSLRCVVTHGETTEPILCGVEQTSLVQLAAFELKEVPESEPSDPCLLIATSGTTSQPKLVLHCQDSVCRHAADVAGAAGIGDAASSMLLALPVCGAFGYTVAMATLQAQRPIVLMESFEPAQAAALIIEHRVTHMLGTNDMLDKLLAATTADRPFPSLRMFGHANFDPSLTELPAKAESKGILIRGFYGMSELLAGFAAEPADAPLQQRAEAGGVPSCPTASFRIADPESGAVMADGEIGELQVRTPNRMREYFMNPRATAEALTADGYFRTGDLAYRAPSGAFIFTSRMNDVLRIGGYLVSPVEIEEVVASDAAVQTCQVVAVTRPQGVRPVAFVIAEPGQVVDEAAVLAMCRARLAIFKVPIRVFTIAALPMIDGPNGPKVRRVALRERAQMLLNAETSSA